MVRVLAFNCDDLSLNPGEDYNFIELNKNCFKIMEKMLKNRMLYKISQYFFDFKPQNILSVKVYGHCK